MDLQRTPAPIDLSEAARRDLAALEALWAALKTGEGDFLFDAWSIADAMFTPVATRVRDYALPVGAAAQAYCDTLLAEECFGDWQAAARAE